MRIKRKSIAMKPIQGGIVDTINVQDKVKNAPSINLVQNMTGIPIEGIIQFDGTEDEIPEGYEKVKIGYSTEETLTGETWIDGKPIYRKVIDLGSIPGTQTILNYSIDIGVETLIDCKGKMINSHTCSLLPTISGEVTAKLNAYASNPVVFIDLIRNVIDAWTDRNFVVTVEYTKATD